MSDFRPAFVLLAIFTVLTGGLYPALVTAVGQALFPSQAHGSLIGESKRASGSRLIGQPFRAPSYFWTRPSATAPVPYNGAASSGSNLGPLNPALAEAVTQRIAALRAADPGNGAKVPIDLVTASASGLDPHVSLAAARYQVARVARARGLDPARVETLVEQHTEQRTLGLFGEPRVNVLELNLALDTVR